MTWFDLIDIQDGPANVLANYMDVLDTSNGFQEQS